MTPLAKLVRPGSTVALADGVGMPRGTVLTELTAAAARVGGVRLFLGWCPIAPDGLDPEAFGDVRAVMGGYGLRKAIDSGAIRYVPARLGTVPALLHDIVRPDLLIAPVAPVVGGSYRFTTEVSWMRAAVDAGATVAGVVQEKSPCCDAGPPLPAERVVPLDVAPGAPGRVPWPEPSDVQLAIAERVAALIPAGARLQFGPGGIGTALLRALRRPVRIDTGIITDAVMQLERRGLLLGTPVAPYLAGSEELYAWADGQPLLHPVEFTHDPARLVAAPPLVAVNTALQIDPAGQVNVESVRGSVVAGIGGQPDYMFAAALAPGGLSVLALPTRHAGHPTLVDALAAPVSTPSHDIDIVVTENDVMDLRGLDRAQRRTALTNAWSAAPATATTTGGE
ncbi:acetyl-CoA hydrolase/transferase C-terminal domain-containing protein [Streptomyces sp. NPDC048254]|uniref:acetyl-CoA hydrolase/transferase C-terminal domain-containing protein n=1 Tax=Streptomyces sp. NPDC048254 TaxID=3365525 RepID=UPI0037114DA4